MIKFMIDTNYHSILLRGCITPSTTAFDFIDKLYEELGEIEEVVHEIKNKTPKKEMFDNLNEEIADVILTALNFAKHFDIDIKTELNNKIQKNYERAELKRMGDTNSTI